MSLSLSFPIKDHLKCLSFFTPFSFSLSLSLAFFSFTVGIIAIYLFTGQRGEVGVIGPLEQIPLTWRAELAEINVTAANLYLLLVLT